MDDARPWITIVCRGQFGDRPPFSFFRREIGGLSPILFILFPDIIRSYTALLRRVGDCLSTAGGNALAPGVDALCPIAFQLGKATGSNAAGLRASIKVHVPATTGLWRDEAAMSGLAWKMPRSFFGPAAQADPQPPHDKYNTASRFLN